MTIPTSTAAPAIADPAITELARIVAAQKKAFAGSPFPSVDERRQHLAILAGAVMSHRDRIEAAMKRDFGEHPAPLTDLTEVLGVAGQAMYASERLPDWVADDQRDVDAVFCGSATARIAYQPKGVVGILAPWNLPFLLSLGPLVDVLAAGNRAVIKPSELAPHCAELIRELVAGAFAEDHVAVVCGGVELARAFAGTGWDHLLFTGSTAVGRQVAVAAAHNLVPVTLELGGKNPVVVGPDSVDERTVAHILGAKLAKSGQVCIAPDYCLVPRAQLDRFVELATGYAAANLTDYTGSVESTGILTDAHVRRLRGMCAEASGLGARTVTLTAEPDPAASTSRQLPLTLVIDPPTDCQLMAEEIFGPVLPVLPFDDLAEVATRVREAGDPLGLYIFSQDRAFVDQVVAGSRSGGVCVNACVLQGVLPSLGFGGVGTSGYGRHRGVEGFREFSVARGIVERGQGDLVDAMFPPYSGLAKQIADAAFAGAAGA